MIVNTQRASFAGLTLAALALSALPLSVSAQAPLAASKAAALAPQALKTSVLPVVARAKKLNRLAAQTEITAHLCFQFADPLGMKDYADAVNDPNSLIYGQWLAPQDIAQRFGPDPADYQAGLKFLKDSGLTVTFLPRHGLSITVKGTAAQMEKAFGVELNEYQEGPADAKIRAAAGADPAPLKFFAHETPLQLPAGLAAKVSGVVGMNNYARPTPLLKKRRDTIISGPFTAAQTRAAYDLNPIYNSNMRGQGRTVGISNFVGVNLGNGPIYISNNGLPTPPGGANSNVSVVAVGQRSTGENAEGDLDFQMVLGMAPLASVIIYDNGTNDLYGVLNQEVSDNNADIISESYGWGFGGGDSSPFSNLHLAMSTQGITYLAASGDSGSVVNSNTPYPDYDPEVLIVGGTIMQYNATTGKYLSEAGWNGSGGGYTNNGNAANMRPAYQAGRGIPSDPAQRLVPDIASAAAGQSSGVDYFFYGGGLNTGDGTSFASPVTAGQLALVEQYLIANNALPANSAAKQRLGRLNDRIYGFNGRNDIFHDVTSGNNGYSATPYWDYVTGWGSLDMYNFAVALQSPLTVKVTAPVGYLPQGQSVQLSAVVTGSVITGYTWSVATGPGTISSSGLYTAPATVTTNTAVTIKATSVLDTASVGNPKASFQPTPFYGSFKVTVYPNRTISGAVTLDGITDPGATAVPLNPFTFVLTPTTSGSAITQTQTLGAGGAFSLTNVPAGTYTLTVKGNKWLRVQSGVITATYANATGLSFALHGGDANNDNSVDSSDFGILIGAFNSSTTIPGSGYDSRADFNSDGLVDSSDFGILISNFNASGV